jgi:hypothetical protein
MEQENILHSTKQKATRSSCCRDLAGLCMRIVVRWLMSRPALHTCSERRRISDKRGTLALHTCTCTHTIEFLFYHVKLVSCVSMVPTNWATSKLSPRVLFLFHRYALWKMRQPLQKKVVITNNPSILFLSSLLIFLVMFDCCFIQIFLKIIIYFIMIYFITK